MLERNKTLKSILSSRQSKEFKNSVEKALVEQWTTYTYSYQTDLLFSRFRQFESAKRTTKKSLDTLDSGFGTQEDDEDRTKLTLIAFSAIVASITAAFSGINYSIADFKNIRTVIEKYSTYISNKGGQSILDKIPGIKKLKFRLSNRKYKGYISDRVDGLIKQLDKTTKKRYKKALANALGKNLTKDETYAELLKVGRGLSKQRAAAIARTESLASFEYMKQETAKVNGMKYKVWTNLGARPCPFCTELDGKQVLINEKFESGDYSVYFPPLHVNCECELFYFSSSLLKESMCESYVISKKYEYTRGDVQGVCLNPEAVWAGGESLVGKDKNVGNLYNEYRRKKTTESRTAVLNRAEAELTPPGFAQLNLKVKKVINKQ